MNYPTGGSPSPNDLVMQALQDSYGLPFLRFVLALGDSCEVGDSVSSERDETMAKLLRISQFQGDAGAEPIELALLLASRERPGGSTLAISLREKNDRAPAPPPSEDPVLDYLLVMARDLYPALLITANFDEPLMMAAVHCVDGSGKSPQFLLDVLDDAALAKLFPCADSHSSAREDPAAARKVSSIVWFDGGGGGGSYYLSLLAPHILVSAYRACLILGANGIEDYYAAVTQGLANARRIAEGEAVDIPVAVGLSGIKFNEAQSVDLPGAALRAVTNLDRAAFPRAVDLDALLVLKLPTSLATTPITHSAGESESGEGWSKIGRASEKWFSELQWSVDRHRLGLLMACEAPESFRVKEVLRAFQGPLSGNGGYHATGGGPKPFRATLSISHQNQAEVAKWVSVVLTSPVESLRVAIRRILSAASSREDATDVLVDSVLAWENMFSGKTDTQLRVCGSMARVLEPERTEERESLYRELKKVYQLRSDIVHGKKVEPSAADVATNAAKAQLAALAAMKQLCQTPQLLECADSDARSLKILLGAVGVESGGGSVQWASR